MKYADFASRLARHPERELVFEFDTKRIHRDYHLTEVLSATINAIDCGGAVDRWTETVLQLLEPSVDTGERYMTAQKASEILLRSQTQVTLFPDSDVVLEFRAQGDGAAQRFHVSGVELSDSGELHVTSVGARTQCKAATRSGSSCTRPDADASCCAPTVAPRSTASATACCAPRERPEGSDASELCCV